MSYSYLEIEINSFEVAARTDRELVFFFLLKHTSPFVHYMRMHTTECYGLCQTILETFTSFFSLY